MLPLRKLCLAASLVMVPAALYAQAHRIAVDPRVELMSIIFRLAGSGEYSQGAVPSYNQAIDSHFAALKDHDAVKIARQLRESDGVSYDAVMSLAINLKDIETLAERVPFDRPDVRLDKRWQGPKARVFLEAARRFTRDSKFHEFLKSQQKLYAITDERLRVFIGQNSDLEWFNRFFGRKAAARMIIAPGLANGGASYGPSVRAEDGVDEIFAIPGVWQTDAEGLPVFKGDWINTLVHEFTHSYANPLIDHFTAQLDSAGIQLYQPLAAEMNQQAYGNGDTVLKESLVRASTARYILDHDGAEAAERAIRLEHARSFLWTRNLVELLGEYSQSRDRYPTMEQFMPRVVDFFNREASQVQQTIRRYEDARPKILSMNIADGAENIEPGERELVVKFDRPMRKTSFAIARTSAIPMPKLGKPAFDDSGTILKVMMTLQPATQYAFSLNWPGGGSFQSEQGIFLKHVAVKFRTRADKE